MPLPKYLLQVCFHRTYAITFPWTPLTMQRGLSMGGNMVTHGVHVHETRSSERLVLQCSIIVATGVQTGEGRVLNLSKHGCLVQSPLHIKAGDHLQLRLFLP